MKKKSIKKVLWSTFSAFMLLVLVLGIHIYIVTRPQPPTATTLVMARADFKQPISKQDAERVTVWLYNQKGVNHVLCNPSSGIAVFTYHPVANNANKIISQLSSQLNYQVKRYIPTKEEMQSGCPVAATSVAYKITRFIQNIF